MNFILTALTCFGLIYTILQNDSRTMCEVFSESDIQKTTSQYLNFLGDKINNLTQEEIKSYFVEDINLDKSKDVPTKTILVWDLGGSYFKLSYVHIGIKNGEVVCEIDKPLEIAYPEMTDETRKIKWEDWAVEKVFDFVKNNKKIPDASSLIVSYPLKYDGMGDARVEKFTKFFCFDNHVNNDETIINSISKSIDNEFTKRFELKEIGPVDENIKSKLKVKTVLNDSVANYFSSKYKNSDFSIGIIVGTGTNAAFPVTIGKKYVFNSEWGSFKPKDITYLPKELELYGRMCLQSNNANFLDVIAANGCKFDLVNSFFPENKTPITKENFKEILNNKEDPRSDVYKTVMKRSKQLIAALTTAVNKYNGCKDCLIITNGSGFDDENECKKFEEELKLLNQIEPIKISLYKEKNLTLKGSALYTFYYLIK